jgi:hypothetical protein
MNHLEANSQLSGLLDNLLTPHQESQLRAHVEICELCDQKLRELRLVDDLVGRMPRELLPREWSKWSGDSTQRLREAAREFLPPRVTAAENGLALRTVVATTTMALVLFMVSVGPWGIDRPEPRTSSGIVASAERKARLVASASFLPESQYIH